VGRSSGSRSIANIAVNSGVVAFQMPATTLDTCCSPNEKHANGIALNTSATTNSRRQISRPRGRRVRVIATRRRSVRAPRKQRPNATSRGSSSSSPTLMNMNDAPQVADSRRNETSQGGTR
jgi:hypothetical protein